MSKLAKVVHVLMGLSFVVFGLNGFLNFIPQPPLPEGPALAFMTGLTQSVYFFPLLKLTEIVCGLALLTGFFVPLALVVLAPVILNIILFHIFLAPSGLAIGIVLAAMGIYLAKIHRSSFAPLLKAA